MQNRKRKIIAFLLGILALIATIILAPGSLLARGGHGIGISAEADSVSASAPDTTSSGFGIPNFVRHVADNIRIATDMNLLVSDTLNRKVTWEQKDGFLSSIDDSTSNEYGYGIHDFGLIYNYFYADPDSGYGVYEEGGNNFNILFKLGPGNSGNPNYYIAEERNHLDYFIGLYGVDKDYFNSTTTGRYTSQFYDADEDPPYSDQDSTIDIKYHLNSCEGYDGVTGTASADSLQWYFSGKHANLMLGHEFQHLCYQAQVDPNGDPADGWPNEFFSTAAEYLAGTLPGSYPWGIYNDTRCDESVVANGNSRFQTWRLFATYLFHQF